MRVLWCLALDPSPLEKLQSGGIAGRQQVKIPLESLGYLQSKTAPNNFSCLENWLRNP
jgi:hypothetical protein